MNAEQIAAAARLTADAIRNAAEGVEDALAFQIARANALQWERFAIEIEATTTSIIEVKNELTEPRAPFLHARARPLYPEADEVGIVRAIRADNVVHVSWLPHFRDTETTAAEWAHPDRIRSYPVETLRFDEFPEGALDDEDRAAIAGDL